MVDWRKAEGGRRRPVLIESWFDPVGNHISNPDVSSVETLVPPQNAGKLLIQTNSQSIRYTLDGTDPSTTAGFVLQPGGDPILIHLRPTVTVKVIEVAATANVEIQYGE